MLLTLFILDDFGRWQLTDCECAVSELVESIREWLAL